MLLTYRSGIIPVLPSTYYDSDSGWGCMLRVAQMFVANLLHRRLKQPFEVVVKLFVDNELAPFSIQMLTCVAMRLFNKKNFEWFNRYSCASSGVYRIIYGLANKFVTRKRS